MQRQTLSRALRHGRSRAYTSNAPRVSRALPSTLSQHRNLAHSTFTPLAVNTQRSKVQCFSTSHINPKGLSPETEDPQPSEREDVIDAALPAELSAEEYTELSDLYMNAIVEKMDELQESREGIDVEYSV